MSTLEAQASTQARSETAVPGLDWPAIAAAGVAIVLWASAFVGIRAVAPELSPGGLAVGRVGVGALALGLVVAAKRPRWPERRWLPSIVVAGTLWYGIYNITLNTGERYVDAGTAAMLVCARASRPGCGLVSGSPSPEP